MKLTFESDVDGQPKPVQMRFGDENDLAELRRWWAYYHRNGETVTSLPELPRPFKDTRARKSLSC
jgi:hypothetical protein